MDNAFSGGGPVRALALLLLVLAAACAGASDTAPISGTRPPAIYASGGSMEVYIPTDRNVVTDAIQATPDEAWAALPKVYADLGIEVKDRSDADRVLGNPRFVVSRRLLGEPLSRYVECGAGLMGPFADTYRIEMLIRSTIQPAEGGKAQVGTYVEATGRNPEGTSNTAVVCASTQRLERAIAERVRLYVEGR